MDNSYKKLAVCAAFSLSLSFNAQAKFDRFESAHVTLDLTTVEHSYNGVSGLYAKSHYLGDRLLVMKQRYDLQMQEPTKLKFMQAWFDEIEYMRQLPRDQMLEALDDRVNDVIEYQADEDSVAQAKEYFFTPYETLKDATGDCEDYAILKYFALKHLGVAEEDMRITHLFAHSNLLVAAEGDKQLFLDNSSWISLDEPKGFYPEREYYVDGPVALLNFTENGERLMRDAATKGRHSYETKDPWGWQEMIYGVFALELLFIAREAALWMRRRRSPKSALGADKQNEALSANIQP